MAGSVDLGVSSELFPIWGSKGLLLGTQPNILSGSQSRVLWSSVYEGCEPLASTSTNHGLHWTDGHEGNRTCTKFLGLSSLQ